MWQRLSTYLAFDCDCFHFVQFLLQTFQHWMHHLPMYCILWLAFLLVKHCHPTLYEALCRFFAVVVIVIVVYNCSWSLWVYYFYSAGDHCRFESGAFQGSDIFTSRPTLSAVTSSSTGNGSGSVCLRSIMNWLERVLTALDCYSWTFGRNLLSPSQLLIGQLIWLVNFFLDQELSPYCYNTRFIVLVVVVVVIVVVVVGVTLIRKAWE